MTGERDLGWEPVWRFDFGGAKQASARAPVFRGDAVHQLFHYRKGRGWESTLVALDAATGDERWRRVFDHVANEPVVRPNGRIVVGDLGGEVAALAASGERLWSVRCGEAGLGKPCFAGDTLIVAEIGGSARHTYGLDPATGEVRWRFETGGHAYPVAATPALAVHATAGRGSAVRLVALSVGTGQPAWDLSSDEYLFRPLIRDDVVWIGARGSLRGHRLIDGSEIARFDLAQPAAVDAGPVPTADGFLVADDSGTVRRLRLQAGRRLLRSVPELTEAWAWSIPDEIAGGPIDLGDAVAVLGRRGVLHVLDAATGRPAGPLVAVENGRDIVGGIAAGANGRLAVAFDRTLEVYRRTDAAGAS